MTELTPCLVGLDIKGETPLILNQQLTGTVSH